MPKRHLNDENKENEFEQPSSSILKHADTSDPIPMKKAKIIDQEDEPNLQNIEPELPPDDEEKGPCPISSVIEPELPPDDEEKGPYPISSVIEHNNGTIYPANKQYFVYEDTDLHMISKTARFWSRKYQKVLHHVNPDTYDMYIHNDFVCYGELEVIENCLLDIAKGIFLKSKHPMNDILAFRRLEALTIILDYANGFCGIDDGDRYCQIIRVIGACYVTILRGLLPKCMFSQRATEELSYEDMKKLSKISNQLPNFKGVIEQALIVGRMYLSIGQICSGYTKILQIVYFNWSLVVENIPIDLNQKVEEKNENLWEALKQAVAIKQNSFKESFVFVNELATYAENNPDLGGNSHDLRKWSKTRRNLYSFDNIDDEDDDENFWFRM